MIDDLASYVRSALEAPVMVVEACGAARDTVVRIAASGAATVVVLVGPAMARIERTMLLAAIGAIAIERAPAGRIVALDIAEDADPAAIVAAARYLAGATSTTGQVVRIAAD